MAARRFFLASLGAPLEIIWFPYRAYNIWIHLEPGVLRMLDHDYI